MGFSALNKGAPVQTKLLGGKTGIPVIPKFENWGLPQEGIAQRLGLTTRAPEGKRRILCKACFRRMPTIATSGQASVLKTVLHWSASVNALMPVFAEGELRQGGNMDLMKVGRFCGEWAAKGKLSEAVAIVKFLMTYEEIIKWNQKRRRRLWLRMLSRRN